MLVIASCGPTSQLRRANRLIDKAENLGAVWRVDTVLISIPVIVPETRIDSILTSSPGDTVIIQKDKLKIVYVRLPGEKVFIEGECAADTVYKRVPVTITKVISAPKSNWWRALLIGAGIGAFLVLFVLFVLRR